jgi:SEC-C motif domain protein
MPDDSKNCPCGSGHTLDNCCGPILAQDKLADTAERLMRARFSAYVLGVTDFLVASWDSSTCPSRSKLDQGSEVVWNDLQILGSEKGGLEDESGTVEFIARGHASGKVITLHETSRFKKLLGHWLYVDGMIHASKKPSTRISRNAPCPCGSGKKYKRCCGA